MADQPDIDTIVERIQQREAARKEEERVKAERVAAWRKGSIELTDIEIHELAVKILIDKLMSTGSHGFSNSVKRLTEVILLTTFKIKEDAEKEIALYTAGLTLNPKMVEGYIKRGNAYSYIGECQ